MSIRTLDPRPMATRTVSACDTLINKHLHRTPNERIGLTPDEVRAAIAPFIIKDEPKPEMTRTQLDYEVLCILEEVGMVSPAEITDRTGANAHAVGQSVNRLIDRGHAVTRYQKRESLYYIYKS